MSDNNFISIVLPVYNGERYLTEAIKSILNQTFSDFELIVVNDCSTDTTEKIVRKFMDQDKRISLISNLVNQKLPESLNIGFRNARGNYFTWTSDDNRYHPDALMKMICFMNENPQYGMVYSDMYLIDKDGNIIGSRTSKEGDYYKYNCIGASFLYRSECRDTVGDYDAGRFLVEDYDYWLRIAKKYKIGHIEDFLYDYRFHDKSLSFSKMKQVGKCLAELKCEYLQKILKNLTREAVLSVLYEIAVYGDKDLVEKNQQIFQSVEKDISWFFQRNKALTDEKVWLFGAGAIGVKALHFIGEDRVIGFVDNYANKVGTQVEEKNIISFSDYIALEKRGQIIISADVRNAYFIVSQLRENGVTDYIVFYDLLTD